VRPGIAALAVIALALVLVILEVHAADAPVHAPSDARLSTGSGSFDFVLGKGDGARRITVWYHRPAEAAADAPIVFVLHGQGRNASTYRKYWIPFAERQRFVLLVPEFSRAEFPGLLEYNLGNMKTADGKPLPEDHWSFSAIEQIFDRVRQANGLRQTTYDIYGHSGGGQFVHRMVLFMPKARFRVAVAANSGWYLMPERSIAYPYGLAGSGLEPERLAQAFSRRLVLLLGDADIDPNHPALRRTPEADAQGAHRFARGHAFFERAQRAAAELGVPLAWKLEVAPGVAHSNARMAPHAARFVGGGDGSMAGSSSTDHSASTTAEADALRR
jgi:poly(3-hydroxybutyrate) depolymerase